MKTFEKDGAPEQYLPIVEQGLIRNNNWTLLKIPDASMTASATKFMQLETGATSNFDILPSDKRTYGGLYENLHVSKASREQKDSLEVSHNYRIREIRLVYAYVRLV